MKKLLYITNIGGKEMKINFAQAAVDAAHALNLTFYTVCNRSQSNAQQMKLDGEKYGVEVFHADIARSPYSTANIKAYKQLVNLIKNEKIDYIHCNTPVGGLLGRLAGKKCKVKKVIYQAHGFHFYKGAPKKNWFFYYPVEKWLSRYTDAIVTINNEDYEFAKSKLKPHNNGNVYYVHGVGIDTTQYSIDNSIRAEKLKELGIPSDAFVLISVGELNENKNNTVIISAMQKLGCKNLHYVLCGIGDKQAALETQAQSAGLENNVHFLGYRNDVKELYQMADCFVMPSYREGLSRSIMEAMASALPCVVSQIRGNTDMIVQAQGGFLCKTDDVDDYAEKIGALLNDKELCSRMGEYNLTAVKSFDIKAVSEEIKNIYQSEFI